MKNIRHIKNLLISGMSTILLGAATVSCTDLDEVTFDRIDSSTYYQDENSVKSAVASIYSNVTGGIFEYFEFLQEMPGDQMGWRCWNNNWGWDEGQKYMLETYTWNSESTIIRQAWEHAWETIGLCTLLIEDLKSINPGSIGMTEESFAAYVAEIKTMRAFCYYNNFELWGGTLPITDRVTTEVPGSASSDFNEGCKLVWEFIADELDSCYEDMVKEDNAMGTRTRFSMGANRILKMRLLLNSELWTGVDRFNECEILAEEIIDGKYGNYSLATDYRDIYNVGNENCSEVIFGIAQKVGSLTNNNRNTPALPLAYGPLFGTDNEQTGWNCTMMVPSKDNSGTILNDIGKDYGTANPKSFIFDYGDKLGAPMDRMNDKDIRKQPFHCDAAGEWQGRMLMGPQYIYENNEPFLADADLDGLPLIYVDQVGSFGNIGQPLAEVQDPRWGMTNSGYRFIQYPIYPETSGLDWRDAIQVEMRLAECYYAKAECQMRRGDSNGAANTINQVRKRYFTSENQGELNNPSPGFTAFDLDWVLSEWGLEYMWEGRRRRTDLRRFDKFTQGTWWFWGRAKAIDRELPAKRDRKYEWYPLPQAALMVNPGLVQNPNY
ncbi:MAG: RagB/SusD family nutrient uptake outer membrane protein [Muribaculaceae bacterium]|nr:RagB/SusD family nutrient uptake outer membrane protein [Muribaculaceae bacterium]